jgi:hypothetical protein
MTEVSAHIHAERGDESAPASYQTHTSLWYSNTCHERALATLCAVEPRDESLVQIGLDGTHKRARKYSGGFLE